MIKTKYTKRSIALLSIFLIIFGVLMWRIKVITIDEAGSLSTMLSSQYSDPVKIADLNYIIFDKNGKQMLDYENKYTAAIDTEAFSKNHDNDSDLFALTYILRNYNADYNLMELGLGRNSGIKRFDIDEATYKKLQNIKGVKGFYTYISHIVDRTEAWRVENMLSSIKDPATDKNKQPDSLEMQVFQKTKNNQYLKQVFTKDLDGNITGSETKIGGNNVNIRLTLDINIQDKVKDVITSEKYTKYNQIGVVLMESSTGKLLSMTQKNDKEPNVNLGSTGVGFAPGSIFKVIVEEAGLDRKSISLNQKFACKTEPYIGSFDMCPDHDHGTINVEDALRVSCNNIFAQIGDKVGVNNFIDNAELQGLFSKVLNFDSEAPRSVATEEEKYVRPKEGEGAGQLAIGQSMSITPIQAISIANTVVNDGYYIKPYLIDALVDNDSKEITVLKTEKHPSINKSTANILKNQMIKVVTNGTGTAARVSNIEVGGKTGTSTRYDAGAKKSDGWFAGFFKVNNKYYSMVVFVKDIDLKNEQAASTAAPIFKDIVLALNDYFQK